MRIHADTLTLSDVYAAARLARADIEVTEHGSRSRKRAFNVHLTGDSNRRTNRRGVDGDVYAATWDQWGVFLAALFDADETLTTPYYVDKAEFNQRTGDRFVKRLGATAEEPALFTYWPADAHGDHWFKFQGVMFEQSCTKCTAVHRWGPR